MGWGEKHITCFPDKLTLRSAQGCQDTASFLWESDWYLSCFSFSFFLPLQIQVHILFNLVEIRSRYKEIYWFCLIETFCHVLDLKLWNFATHLKFSLSDSTPFQGDERVLLLAQMRELRKSHQGTVIIQAQWSPILWIWLTWASPDCCPASM